MARLLVGTSGYVYADWRGRFYPRGLPATAWLRYYGGVFHSVELNSPFYRLPATATFRAWAAAVPPRFVFAVKASRFMTHVKRLREPGRPLARLLRRAGALGPAMGPVLVQLPPQFHLSLERLDALLHAVARRPALRVVLEIRHPSWLVDEVFERLTRANVALCLHDARAQPVTAPVTADFVYVRRHGTRRPGGGPYTRRMLAADAARIRGWLAGGRDVYVYYNNDGRAAAVRNALQLRALVGNGRGRRAA